MKKVRVSRRQVSKMKLPVCKDSTWFFPKVPRCPQCKRHKVFEPHSMAILSGGALLMDRKRQNSVHDDRQLGFLNLCWHGAHDNGFGKDRDIGADIDVVADCRGGQFDLYFCSTECLRAFLNACVDALELEVQKQKLKTPRQLATEEKKELARLIAKGVIEVRDSVHSS